MVNLSGRLPSKLISPIRRNYVTSTIVELRTGKHLYYAVELRTGKHLYYALLHSFPIEEFIRVLKIDVEKLNA